LPTNSRQVFLARLPFNENMREANRRLKMISVEVDSMLIKAKEKSKQRQMPNVERTKKE
jgi:hypothetical protein